MSSADVKTSEYFKYVIVLMTTQSKCNKKLSNAQMKMYILFKK